MCAAATLRAAYKPIKLKQANQPSAASKVDCTPAVTKGLRSSGANSLPSTPADYRQPADYRPPPAHEPLDLLARD